MTHAAPGEAETPFAVALGEEIERKRAKQARLIARRTLMPARSTEVDRALARAEGKSRRAAAEHERAVVIPRRVEKTTMLERYRRRGSIDSRQHRAAERLQELHAHSGYAPRLVAGYGAGSGGAPPGPGLGPTSAEYAAAMRAVGIILSPVLVAVVLEDRAAEAWALSTNRPGKDGIAALRLALDALVEHFGYKAG